MSFGAREEGGGYGGGRTYVVQPGDSPMRIAERLTGDGRNYLDLVGANPWKPRVGVGAEPTFRSLDVNERILLPSRWRRGAFGLGAECGGLSSTPEFQSAWSDVEKQIRSEGKGNAEVALVKGYFCDSLNELAKAPGAAGHVREILDAAKKYTAVAQSVAGAVAHVEGLAEAAKTGPTSQVVQQMAALVVTVAVAAGASAGIGAIVMLGAAFVGDLLDKLGVFGKTKGVAIAGCSISCDPPPVFVLNCTCFWDPIVKSPGSPNWRAFPGGAARGAWRPESSDWFAPRTIGISNWRLVDRAFPYFHQLECEQTVGYALRGIRLQDVGAIRGAAIYGFLGTYFGAWKANKEYALNGLQAAEDWQVLLSTVEAWNRAHEPGDGWDIAEAPRSLLLAPGETCRDGMIPYVETLVADVLNGAQGDRYPNRKIRVNTGPRKTFPVDEPRLARLGLVGMESAGEGSGASSSKSSAGKIVLYTLGAGAIAAAGLYAYASYKHTTIPALYRGVRAKF